MRVSDFKHTALGRSHGCSISVSGMHRSVRTCGDCSDGLMATRPSGDSSLRLCEAGAMIVPRTGDLASAMYVNGEHYVHKQEVVHTASIALRAVLGCTVTQNIVDNVTSMVMQLRPFTPMAFATNPGPAVNGTQSVKHGAAGDLPQGTTGYVSRHVDGVELGLLGLHTSHPASRPCEMEGQGAATLRHFIGSEAGDECLWQHSEGVENMQDWHDDDALTVVPQGPPSACSGRGSQGTGKASSPARERMLPGGEYGGQKMTFSNDGSEEDDDDVIQAFLSGGLQRGGGSGSAGGSDGSRSSFQDMCVHVYPVARFRAAAESGRLECEGHGPELEGSEKSNGDETKAAEEEAMAADDVSHGAIGLPVHPVLPFSPNPFYIHQKPPFHDPLPTLAVTSPTLCPLNRFCADPAFPGGGWGWWGWRWWRWYWK